MIGRFFSPVDRLQIETFPAVLPYNSLVCLQTREVYWLQQRISRFDGMNFLFSKYVAALLYIKVAARASDLSTSSNG